MNIILFDDQTRSTLLPLTYTRPIADIRIGILKISEKWEKICEAKCSFLTEQYLQELFPVSVSDDNYFINGSLLPTTELVAEIKSLNIGEALISDDLILAIRSGKQDGLKNFTDVKIEKSRVTQSKFDRLVFPWDIFSKNEKELQSDFVLLTKGRKSQPLSSSNRVINPENIFLEPGAVVECANLNAASGCIYVGKDSEIMEGAMIRGPFAIGDHSAVKMGAKIYGATTVGPHCKVAGEISNSVIFGYSNKAHDGFLGNSVLGEWCNLGADTNNSNLKNNYSKVKVWSYQEHDYINTGLQFCGLIMGDHSKCSINTMFNTGTVVGVSANIFGNGFPPKFVPSFSWGGSEGFTSYRLEDASEVASRVYERRHLEFGKKEKDLLKYLFEESTKYRAW
ncbi:MAG: GlmU family protein [Bacteroidetes bacterium]|nr:GlmU family protein [Bacteroidota bacterium]MBK7572187.1 GlmU family protein [Bacteroidota bacterium]MBK8584024.1 GlmU family protein [Bacteroidota bacterium]